MKSWLLLTFCLFSLGGCYDHGNYCAQSFAGGCVPGPSYGEPEGTESAPAATVAPAAPAMAPAAARMPLGDPSTFADVDDKQCRSYGLAFGSHDYADCRIRLSAQHRGLDPNIGAPAPGSR